MSYARELLDSAVASYQSVPETQANLRRAVSTAYYALFHFLIDEACNNWTRSEQRRKLSRMFDHKQMYTASSRAAAKYNKSAPGSVEFHVHRVAHAFQQLQDNRHIADYDLSGVLASPDVALDIRLVERAFASWQIIRNEQIAHDYLFSLLFRDR